MAVLRFEELRDILASFLRRVIIDDSEVQLLISRTDLRQRLEQGDKPLPVNLEGPRQAVNPDDVICLTIEARLKRCGGEVHLVVPPNSGFAAAHPKQSLIKAMARAHGWYQQVIRGEVFDVSSLACQLKLTKRYVGKVFACAFLAPDIVESILTGRQPEDLSFEKLCKQIPFNWSEQRARFGFPSEPSLTR